MKGIIYVGKNTNRYVNFREKKNYLPDPNPHSEAGPDPGGQ
jgi:hypothetical protein